ncbi:FG-GAP-like repeat-containing protein [Candidatus Chloroploca sp. Khr17]|uniref:FG-GAP-like repeat-containing protein n=1 Tax=Candidatus Chloroploca sp. Khr17 TaxID=2496869 RepID=UPI0013EDCF49|nr:FG-GAP-like repeat-containing protein [Candidatus Chloroploca sp. Khr17]
MNRTTPLRKLTSLVALLIVARLIGSLFHQMPVATATLPPSVISTVGELLSVTRWVDDLGYDAVAGSWRINQHPRMMADVNGDGKADLVGFGEAGVYVARSTGSGFETPQLQVNDFGFTAGGWRVDQHVRTVIDVSGDGKADIVGFGNSGVYVASATGTGFLRPQNYHTHFGYDLAAGGWRVDRHLRLLGDMNGDGRADIVGFHDNGVYLARSTGTGFEPEYLTLENSFGYADAAGGWRIDRHPRMLVDVNGDRRVDIVGFGDVGVYVAFSTGEGFTVPMLAVNDFGYTAGNWRTEQHLRMLADVNGDGRADIVGFGGDGVYVALASGVGFHPPQLMINDFGYVAGGWRIDQHPRMLADVNADGKADIVGFGNQGVYVALSTGSSFSPPQLSILDYGYYAGGWRTDRNLRLMADANGDGKADVVGFGNQGVYVSTDLLAPPNPSPSCAVPFFSQRDPGWANHPLRTDGECSASCNTIGKCGCTLTSAAMVFKYYGANLNPASLSDCMGTSGCPFSWGVGASCSGSQATLVGNDGFSWARLAQAVQANGPVLLGMTQGQNQHWVVVLSGSGTSAGNYSIHDPWPLNGANMRLSAYNGWSFNNILVYAGQKKCVGSLVDGNTPLSFQAQPVSATVNEGGQLSSEALTLVEAAALPTSSAVTGSLELYRSNDTTLTIQLGAESSAAKMTDMLIWTDAMEQATWQPFAAFAEAPIGEVISARFRDASGNISAIVSDTRYPTNSPATQPQALTVFLPIVRR